MPFEFSFTDEQEKFRRDVRDFIHSEILPTISKYDKLEEFPSENVSKMAEQGYFGLTVPEKYGGKAEKAWEDLDKAPSNSEPSDKDFITTLLICVFLGGLGVHRFFVDKMGTGVLMLVTLGGLGLWWIIDIILIVTGSFEDSEGRVIAYQAAGTANTAPSTHVPEKVAEAPPAKDIPAEIRKFAELKKDGLISEEEFDKKKKELLR